MIEQLNSPKKFQIIFSSFCQLYLYTLILVIEKSEDNFRKLKELKQNTYKTNNTRDY